jgi:signal transduction histidine kinase
LEYLKYIVEDNTIAELLGIQNFTNKESAILELVKNAYDAKATLLVINFQDDTIIVTDNGSGMDSNDIKQHWMHVGKSDKMYDVVDANNKRRILAGSKGIGRFALSRLGKCVSVYSKKSGLQSQGVIWKTDWNSSTLSEDETMTECGTRIVINGLRDKWGKKAIEKLSDYLSETYNDDSMLIQICYSEGKISISKYFPEPKLGLNCLSNIHISYDSCNNMLTTTVTSDEFLEKAQEYCHNYDIHKFEAITDIVDEFKDMSKWDLPEDDLADHLHQLGDFSAEMYFNVNSTSVEMDKYLYKYSSLPENLKGGIALYRNAFSISAYEGKKDWLELGKRSRRSPAAASHPSGAWRVRENQLAGKIEIDKQINSVLQDLSNRQGLNEDIFYELFVEIILTGIKEFERYRQGIVRAIDVKNELLPERKPTPISDKVISNPLTVSKLSSQEAKQLVSEIKTYRQENFNSKQEKVDTEERYKYDVRILNVLATTGLKASSIAHEMRNDRNIVADSCNNIILALKEYEIWDELMTPEKTAKAYKNVPYLLETNQHVNKKIVAFMDTMLTEIEKKQFEASWQSISDLLNKIKEVWERDYAWISILPSLEDDICFLVSEDIIYVVFDNLILNSIQQNDRQEHLNISISVKENGDKLLFTYSDNGKGLDKKYLANPRKILEVHETTRKNGHGLGMWIVNNTVIMSGGEISNIQSVNGFTIEFSIGDKM